MVTLVEEVRLNPKILGSELVGLFVEATPKYYFDFLQLKLSSLAFPEENVPAIVWKNKLLLDISLQLYTYDVQL